MRALLSRGDRAEVGPVGPTALSRRDLAMLVAAGVAGVLVPGWSLGAEVASGKLRTRAIPHSGEMLPVVGLGTAMVFDVGSGPQDRAGCAEVVRALAANGGTLIDTAPSYGSAESVIGAILAETGLRQQVFLSTKLERFGGGQEAGGLHDSLQRMRVGKVDLLQLHNVRDPGQDLAALRALKDQGLCRYTGITTTFGGAYDAVESVLKRERPDFVEIDYAIDNRKAEARVIPAAADAGAAILVALPFGRGRLFRSALGRPLPDWAAEFDCTSWAQFFLKFILGHPAVTAAIPGTDKAAHMIDNLGAGRGRLPDAAMRARMVQHVESLG
jgi:aryl-alcohol dehydrogenase-like predicted oxidoreductase